MSRFLIACGGTGGHLAPGIALAETLLARGHEAILFISQKRVDARFVEQYPKLKTVCVPSASFGWRPDVQLRFHWRQAQGLFFSLKFFRVWRFDVIVGFGAFTNAAVVLAGWLVNIPIVLHEANRVPGRAIRLLARFANLLYLPPGVRLGSQRGLTSRHVGLPVRSTVRRLPKFEARAVLGVDPSQKLLVVLGGSQGSGSLNDWFEMSAETFACEEVQLWCVTGLGKGADGVREFRSRNGNTVRAWRESFSDRVGTLLSAADLAVSRAGAGTIAELIRCETPAILVPLPTAADNHQWANARNFEQQGGGIAVDQSTLSLLQQEVLDVLSNDWLLNKFRDNLHRMAREDTIEILVSDLEALAQKLPLVHHRRYTPAQSKEA